MGVINEGVEPGEEPVVNSRYGVVCATAKRARQLIDGAEPLIDDTEDSKPLSIAVNELYSGKLHILSDEENRETQEKIHEAHADFEEE